MAENLVPTGGPYDSRQDTVALMQQAGLPLNVEAAPPTAPALSGPAASSSPGLPPSDDEQPVSGEDLLLGNGPEEFPWLGEPQAPVATEEPGMAIPALALTSQSTFGSAVLARLQSRR